ncbi:precorrin-3B synthase [Bradyrhizobium lablabi]|uniref:Precorrin-3B synthase n=1 Tax=Bradyrhizobium lablabi TaxID=722472 RepID=A0A1M6SAV9_9BRAD|nr:precorrin-3B synthase [Bradyrhizobium lablabi]SHK41835.1 precorrin-3B synthase [Bradyrhizobium lablabi]
MKHAAVFEVKGWCPGALKPMQSGDGLIVRVRPRCGMFKPDEMLVLAEAARRFGNGHIDLTRRANLQIRGVGEESLLGLQHVIAGLGLLDPAPEAEAVRNLMVSPLAGIDPTEVLDVRGIARELAQLLTSEHALWALPSKFCFIIDGCGTLTLADERADIRIAAIRDGANPSVAIGLDTQAGIDWLGSVSAAAAATAATETASAFLAVVSNVKRQRMRAVPAEGLASIRSAMRSRLNPLELDQRKTQRSSDRHVGLRDLGAGRFAVGVAAPFGRVETAQLEKLAGEMAAFGVEEVRLSPWRILYAEVVGALTGNAVLDAARSVDLITDPDDPLLRVEACPGAPACRSTSLDTRGDARRLAALSSRFGFEGTIHVSGCAKGCAKSAAADLVLVGAESKYGIVRNGTAQECPAGSASFAELAADPGTIFAEGRRYD